MEIRKSENLKIDFHMIFLWNFPENIDLQNIFSNCSQNFLKPNLLFVFFQNAPGYHDNDGGGWSRVVPASTSR